MNGLLPLARLTAVFVAVGVVAATTSRATTQWTNENSGFWSDAGNWDSGVPDNELAALVNPNPGDTPRITITFTNPAAPSFSRLICYSGTTLDINTNGFEIGGSCDESRVDAGAVVNVNTGCVWTYTGTNNSGSLLEMEGGELNITGGWMIFTNLHGINRDLVVGGSGQAAGETGVLTITSGGIEWGGDGVGKCHFRVGGVGTYDPGVMNVHGGTVLLDCGSSGEGCYIGFAQQQAPGGEPAYGELNITGGHVEFTNQTLLQGFVGRYRGAVGVLRISGGEFVSPGYLYIGSKNGTGIVEVTDGKLTVATQLGIGQSSSLGTMTVSGGTVSVPTLSFGSATGTVSMVGSGGSVAATNLTATGTGSVLRFEFDADGVSAITVNNLLTVDADTTLEVDITDYNRANGLVMPLIYYGSRSGTITNITVSGLDGGTVDQGSGSSDQIKLNVNPPRGTVFMIR